MELILIESVEGLGRPGDRVKVRAGHARNYLLPQRKAVPIGAEVLRKLDQLKAKGEAEERALVTSMEELSKRLAGTRVEISARATEEGHLFGSVNEKDIHAVLAAAGWEIPARGVRLATHIKEAGETRVELHLHGQITAEIVVDVIPVDGQGNRIEIVEAAPQSATEPAADEGDEDTGADD